MGTRKGLPHGRHCDSSSPAKGFSPKKTLLCLLTTAMQQDAAEAHGKPGLEDLISNSKALALAYSGHLAEARKMSERAADLAQKADHPGMAALYEVQASLREGLVGNEQAAKQRAVAALGLSKNRDVEYGAAFALALSGDYSGLRHLQMIWQTVSRKTRR
jgi:hypothetical protein